MISVRICGWVGNITYILINVSTCSIHHDVIGDVGLHTLGHENTRTLLLVVSVLVTEITDHLRATWLIPIRAINSRARRQKRVVAFRPPPQCYRGIANHRQFR